MTYLAYIKKNNSNMMKYYDIIIVIIFLKTHFVIKMDKVKVSIMAIWIIGFKFLFSLLYEIKSRTFLGHSAEIERRHSG